MALCDAIRMSDTDTDFTGTQIAAGHVVIPTDVNDKTSLAVPKIYHAYLPQTLSFAIVAGIDAGGNIILSSENGNMRWVKTPAQMAAFSIFGKAKPEIANIAATRLAN